MMIFNYRSVVLLYTIFIEKSFEHQFHQEIAIFFVEKIRVKHEYHQKITLSNPLHT
jgi:hypothetical protein